MLNCARQVCASRCRARKLSGTTICGSGKRQLPVDHGTDRAALGRGGHELAAPSKFGPRNRDEQVPRQPACGYRSTPRRSAMIIAGNVRRRPAPHRARCVSSQHPQHEKHAAAPM
jgi:hypothetical protein